MRYLWGIALLGMLVASHGQAASGYKKYFKEYQKPTKVPYPDDNKYSSARDQLGKTLFFDPRISGSGWISCATCHNPALGWEDSLSLGFGHGMKKLGRHTPTILNLAWGELFFWDGRASSLEEQALGPIEAAGEMNMNHDKMIAVLKSIKGYKPLFQKAYPKLGISKEAVGKAIATFERGVVSAKAPFDRWVAGNERAISESAKRGFVVFNEKGKCANCHSGWRFTDDGFHDIGLKSKDKGRGGILKQIAAVQFAFKTPTLRNISQRGPYLHDGSEKTLMDVVEFYDRGGDTSRPSKSADVMKLGLTRKEKKDLVAFLNTLTSKDKAIEIPVLPQ